MKCQDCLNWFIQAEDELLLLFINQNDCRETGATELQLIHSQFLQSVNFAKKKTDPGKSHTFSAALVMTYEVWQLAANCSSCKLPQGQEMSLLPRVSQHPQSVMTRSHTHAHTANAHSYNTETCTRAEHTSYLICFR